MGGGEPLSRCPIAARQGQLLAPRPALDLLLPGKSLLPACELLLEYQSHRQPRCRISRKDAQPVRRKPGFQIVCMPCVDGAIRTLEHVDVEAHKTPSPRSWFDRLTTSGWGRPGTSPPPRFELSHPTSPAARPGR